MHRADHGSRASRWGLLLLIAAGFIPEILILAVALASAATGCRADQPGPCPLGGSTAAAAISWLFQPLAALAILVSNVPVWLAAFYLVLAVWSGACYLLIARGWRSLGGRLAVGLAFMIIAAVLPFSAPLFTIAVISDQRRCLPSLGGGSECFIFGGRIERADAVLTLADPTLQAGGILLAVTIFTAFVGAIIWIRLRRTPGRTLE